MADGLHARTDGLTSLAVLIAAGGTLAGFPIVDPIIGLLIGVAILFITRDAIRRVWYRLMDAVDPSIVDEIEHALGHVAGVRKIEQVKARWLGHRLMTDVVVEVDGKLDLQAGHALGKVIENTLHEHLPQLSDVAVRMSPSQPAA